MSTAFWERKTNLNQRKGIQVDITLSSSVDILSYTLFLKNMVYQCFLHSTIQAAKFCHKVRVRGVITHDWIINFSKTAECMIFNALSKVDSAFGRTRFLAHSVTVSQNCFIFLTELDSKLQGNFEVHMTWLNVEL